MFDCVTWVVAFVVWVFVFNFGCLCSVCLLPWVLFGLLLVFICLLIVLLDFPVWVILLWETFLCLGVYVFGWAFIGCFVCG